MIKFRLLIAVMMLVASSCSQEEEIPNQNDRIVFGHFYGFCVGEQCIEIFKLTESNLYEDNADNYPSSEKPYEGNFIKMDQEKFELVKDLAQNIPDALINTQDTIIGMPDYADGGGLYFAIDNEDGTRYWLIDQMKHNIPEELHPFVDELNRNIGLISN